MMSVLRKLAHTVYYRTCLHLGYEFSLKLGRITARKTKEGVMVRCTLCNKSPLEETAKHFVHNFCNRVAKVGMLLASL